MNSKNEPSNINELHLQAILLKMQGKSTEELISIWTENDQKAYSKEEFATVQKLLRERVEQLPAQRAIYKGPFQTPAEKKIWFDPDPTYIPYSPGPSLRNQLRIAMAVIIFLLLSLACFGWFALYLDKAMK